MVIKSENLELKIPLTYIDDGAKKLEIEGEITKLPNPTKNVYLTKDTNVKNINLPKVQNQSIVYI